MNFLNLAAQIGKIHNMHNMDKLCLDQTFSLPWTSAGNPLAPHCCLAILGTLLHHGHLLSYSEGEVILGEEFLFMFCNRSSSVWEEMARPLLKRTPPAVSSSGRRGFSGLMAMLWAFASWIFSSSIAWAVSGVSTSLLHPGLTHCKRAMVPSSSLEILPYK